ncbi:GlxA family transcriptional regulator [uncultured Vibrio sp.]|uniref:GlxA family transcriptional regulator n=1 Tax=uncultured Vibrio sp. TaxID=114054 RepID=UPI0025F53A0B|nr:helix-turn-helix domain-containing protein [uncultured Vibrio sp.]
MTKTDLFKSLMDKPKAGHRMDTKPIKVGILVSEHTMLSAVAGIEDILSIANHIRSQTFFDIERVKVEQATAFDSVDLLFVPPAKLGTKPNFHDDVMLKALIEAGQQGTTIAANCASVFWLANAGLLNQRSATTHWKLCDKLEAEHPDILQVKKHQMVVDEGAIITGSGLFAFQDVTLHLIARFCGFELAHEVADMCLLDFSGRLQAHYERFVPDYSHGNELVLKAQKYCEQTPLKEQSNQAMANVCNVSEKTLTRSFKRSLSLTPQQYRLRYKMDLAKKEISINHCTVEQAAYLVGYNDVSNFSRVFKKVVGISPSEYRAR